MSKTEYEVPATPAGKRLYFLADIFYNILNDARQEIYTKRENCPLCWHDHLADGVQGEDFCEDERWQLAMQLAEKVLNMIKIDTKSIGKRISEEKFKSKVNGKEIELGIAGLIGPDKFIKLYSDIEKMDVIRLEE